jgi:hypothetical protein
MNTLAQILPRTNDWLKRGKLDLSIIGDISLPFSELFLCPKCVKQFYNILPNITL